MDVRAQVSMVFHLDKCIGCHTCSVACKNIWTDRKGTEYMWWNNVETKPGTGFPTKWEDQAEYKGGWEKTENGLQLKGQSRLGALGNLFFNPNMPKVDDYYEPWTYKYEDLFNAPAGDDQPTARPISLITGDEMEINAGPNWDDDLGGSDIYAKNDPNLRDLSDQERERLLEIERLVFFYLPRICNHCLNPSCVASCPSGALYKRGEDGIVLVNQDKCRAWRMCVSGCPYKKVYYNWSTGKSEKCILCFPRLETGQAPACFHSCVGRIRYLGVILYDADRITEAGMVPDNRLVEAQRNILLDPNDPEVIAKARANGIPDAMIDAAQKSPVYKFVKEWKIALPLHPEFRTMAMLFYIPPLLPVTGAAGNGATFRNADDFFTSLENARMPIRFMASLFSAGNETEMVNVYKKLMAVRMYKRAETVGDISVADAAKVLVEAGMTAEEAEAMYKLTALPTFEQRFVIPPLAREMAISAATDVFMHKQGAGIGFREPPQRGF